MKRAQCEVELSASELGEHQGDEHDVILLSHDRQCRNCGKQVSSPDPYCDSQCHDEFWSRRFPGMAAREIVHSEEYNLLNGRYGELPQREVADLFGPGRSHHVVDLEWWDRKDRATAAKLEKLKIPRAFKKGS
jgi:hypothetical protein